MNSHTFKLGLKVLSVVTIIVTLILMIKDIFVYELYKPFGGLFLGLLSLMVIFGIAVDFMSGKLQEIFGKAIIGFLLLIVLIITYSMVREMMNNPIIMIIWFMTHMIIVCI